MCDDSYDEPRIRELLIASCHSSVEANKFFRSRLNDTGLLALLFSIAEAPEEIGGDAEMQAAHYISQFSSNLLKPYEINLLALLKRTDALGLGYGGHVALALGKTKSAEGKKLIIAALASEKRFDAWQFKKAMEQYNR